MTYFLDDKPFYQPKVEPTIDALPTMWEGLSASFRMAQIESDSNFRVQRTRNAAVADRARAALTRIDGLSDELEQKYAARGGLSAMEAIDASPNAAEFVLQRAREAAAANPEAWRDIDLSEENITAEINGTLKAEWEDAAMIAEMMGAGTQIVGSMAGLTADVRNAMFLIPGLGAGGGSVLRVMGREAFLNMAAEATFLPSQFEMAERLQIPDPDVPTQLAMAAGAGAVLGGLAEGVSRGLTYWKARNTTAPIPGYSTAESELLVQLTEDALAAGEDVSLPMRNMPPSEPVPPQGRAPLILTPQMRDADNVWDEALAAARERSAPAEATDGPAPPPTEDEVATFIEQQQAIIRERTSDNPLLRLLARGHLQQEGRKLVPVGETLQIKPDGPVGQILRTRDIKPGAKGVPVGLFSRQGRDNLDNLVALEWEDRFPGIIDATGTPRGADYLDEEGLIDVIERAYTGDYSWWRDVGDAIKARDDAMDFLNGNPTDNFLAKTPSEIDDGLFIRPDEFEFDQDQFAARAQIAQVVERHLEANYPDLTRAERDEIISTAQREGGDIDYLAERAYERERDLIRETPDEAADDIPGWGDAAPTAAGADRGVGQAARQGDRGNQVGQEASGGSPGEAGLRTDAQPAQLTVPGTDRVQTGQAQADRATVAARSQQSMMRRLDQKRVEDDPGTLFGTAPRELFDSPEAARPIHDNIAADLRDQIERDGDFIVDMGDGKGERKASTVLDDLDRGDEFAEAIALCGKPAAKAAE